MVQMDGSLPTGVYLQSSKSWGPPREQ